MLIDSMRETLIGLIHSTALAKTFSFMLTRPVKSKALDKTAYVVFLDRELDRTKHCVFGSQES